MNTPDAQRPTPNAAMTPFIKTVLFTDTDGRARFREEAVPLTEGTPQEIVSHPDVRRYYLGADFTL